MGNGTCAALSSAEPITVDPAFAKQIKSIVCCKAFKLPGRYLQLITEFHIFLKRFQAKGRNK